MMQAFKLLALFPLVALSVDFDDYGNDDYRFYDVCEEFSFTSCDFCFANADCFWCPKDGACTSYKGDTWWSCALSDYPDACSDEVNIFRWADSW